MVSRRNVIRIGLAMATLYFDKRRSAAALPIAKSSGPENGSLLAIGGGSIWPEIQRAADALASPGGKPARWIYIPTAGEGDVLTKDRPGFLGRPTILHTRDRSVADSDAFTAPLRDATAVFFDGGRQWGLLMLMPARAPNASCAAFSIAAG